MKVLLDCSVPFSLAHGGQQIQIEQTFRSLKEIGVCVEHLQWWEDSQKADLIHYFGRPPVEYLELARRKGIRVIAAELLTAAGSRAALALRTQRLAIRVARGILPPLVTKRYGWEAFQKADACLALTRWEAHLMQYLFGAQPEKVHVVPNGVEELFLRDSPAQRGPFLVCSAVITERKRVLELAQAACSAKTPLLIIGKPYAPSDPYSLSFLKLCELHHDLLRYEGQVQDRARVAQIYREARGFVLLSTMESLSLAALEAAACGCPLLLSDLPWARTVFGERATYCPITPSIPNTARVLRRFYDQAPELPTATKPLSWIQVADQLRQVYAAVLKISR